MKIIYLFIATTLFLILGVVGCASEPPPVPEPIPALAPPPPSPAEFSVTNLVITPLIAQPTETITITAEVKNTGGTPGNYRAILKLNDEMQAQRTVYITVGGKEYVSFQVRGGRGNYFASIGELSAGYTVLPSVPSTQQAPIYRPPTPTDRYEPPFLSSMRDSYLNQAESYQRQADRAMDNANDLQRMMTYLDLGTQYSQYKRQYQYAMEDYARYQAKANEYIMKALREP